MSALGGRLLETTKTTPDYRLYALPAPRRQNQVCCASKKWQAIEVEVWAMPIEPFGRFTDAVPAPLTIGTVTLAAGRAVKGFLVEAAATTDARDISSFGGWRAYLARENVPA